MSYFGNVTTAFAKWATDQINSLTSRVSSVEGKQVFTKSYTTGQQVITSGGTLTFTHGLGAAPKLITAQLVCLTAEAGYSVGDVFYVDNNADVGSGSASVARGHVITFTQTDMTVRFGNNASAYGILIKNTGGLTAINNTNWRVIFTAYA